MHIRQIGDQQAASRGCPGQVRTGTRRVVRISRSWDGDRSVAAEPVRRPGHRRRPRHRDGPGGDPGETAQVRVARTSTPSPRPAGSRCAQTSPLIPSGPHRRHQQWTRLVLPPGSGPPAGTLRSGFMNARPVLSLPEWTVLTVLSQQPAHGFAVAQLTARHGELGRIWQIPRPVIYRAIGRLVEAGLARPESVQPGLGPQRTIYAATPRGREAAERWLDTPVEHVRDIRSHLLIKLALLDRAGADPADLLKTTARRPGTDRPGHRGRTAPARRFRRDPAGLAPVNGSGGAGIPGHHRPARTPAWTAARLTGAPRSPIDAVTGFAVSP